MNKILVINCGSSSVKYNLYEMTSEVVLASGIVEQIGEAHSRLRQSFTDSSGKVQEITHADRIPNHSAALQAIRSAMQEAKLLDDAEGLKGVGHRVVHGGEDFADPVIIDERVLNCIRANVPLAPLHNPANLVGIEATIAAMPDTPQVAVFDTAFHQTLPAEAYHYAIPRELYTNYRIRRYGFHGTSHFYVTKKSAVLLGKSVDQVNLITLHLGNGASACAVRGGKSVDTSMGMTPLAGLIMGTRCGDIDPGILFHLCAEAGYTTEKLDALLNKQSGLRGICGANDIRDVLRMAHEGSPEARLAISMTCYRLKKYIGSYCAVLGQVDALVFTAGIGENAEEIRAGACAGLDAFGIILDPDRNSASGKEPREIQSSASKVKILVVPTNEELEIAQATLKCVSESLT